MTFSPSLVGLLACTRCIVTLFLALRPHTVHGYVHAATPTRFNITYARPRARKGCAIDQSLPWIDLLTGARVREHHGFSYDILSLSPRRACYVHR